MSERMSLSYLHNPLFLHPSDGSNAISPPTKLSGTSNYRAWKRWMEINLTMERKLGFVHGTLQKPDDHAQGEQWEICNSVVISWIMNSVSDSVSSSILYMHFAHEIWKHLETRFSLSNGSRKYKVNKDIYELKKNNTTISEYYTQMKGLWEEVNAHNELPKLTEITSKISEFLKALAKQDEEQKLFLFLNGLDDVYNSQRSQLLLQNPLPSVETTCSVLQQEESQREILSHDKITTESTALYSKNTAEVCTKCGVKGHPRDKCWKVIGYPDWHPRSQKFPQKKPP